MLLDRIDIDSHGPLARIGLGPFSQQLNVITAAAGVGKTALVRFLRDSLTGTTPAYDGMAQSSGRVVWAAADGLYHCRREPNGTAQGRRFVEFESRLGGHQASRWNRTSVVVDLPATIVDGIVTDTTVTSVRRVVQAVRASGLDQASRPSTSVPDSHQAEIAALRSEIARLQTQLCGEGDNMPREGQTRSRLASLTLELSAIDARREFTRQNAAAEQQARRDRDAIAHAAQEVERLRIQETELRKRIGDLEQQRTQLEEQARRAESRDALVQLTRTRMHWLNQQIDRLRRVLAEVRALGDHWFGGHTGAERVGQQLDADLMRGAVAADKTAAPLTRGELEITDRGWLSGHNFSAVSRSNHTASSAEIEARLESICARVDRLSGRLEAEQEHWMRVDHGPGEIAGELLSEAERALQRLHQPNSVHPNGSLEHDDQSPEVGGDLHGPQQTHADPGWIDDARRRRRIDALRRAHHRRRLDETTDHELVEGQTEDAILITLRAIGTTLHAVSRRLRVLRVQRDPGLTAGASWAEDAWLQGDGFHGALAAPLPLAERAEALRRCERELVATLGRLAQHRVGLLRRIAQLQQLPDSLLEAVVTDALILPAAVDDWLAANLLSSTAAKASESRFSTQTSGQDYESARRRLADQCRELNAALEQTIQQMNHKLAAAEKLTSRFRNQSVLTEADEDRIQRARIESEIHHLHRLLAVPPKPAAFQRYRHCMLRLRELEAGPQSASPLATAANFYLQRLSAGTLQSVVWHDCINPSTGQPHLAVMIDSQPENRCRESDRYLVALAVRMAAADELSHRGRSLPLVIETPARIDDVQNLAATLAESSGRGRQIILLTQDDSLASAVVHVGGRSYTLDRATCSPRLPVQDVNRNFDIQWREAHAIDDVPSDAAAAGVVDATPDDSERSAFDQPAAEHIAPHHSYSMPDTVPLAGAPLAPGRLSPARKPTSAASSEATADHNEPQRHDVVAFPIRDNPIRNGRGGAEVSPFFLSGDSAIEQSPSIDVLAAARLRALDVVVVSQLLTASPQELAENLQTADINAATIRRWQNECRLVCGVAGLRGFDARVLVGCGIVHPQEIAEIHPAELVEKVEAFLATPRGVQILRTGTSHEISRLTGWIAEARQSARGAAAAESTPAKSSARQTGSRPEPELWNQAQGGRKGASRSRLRRRSEPQSSEQEPANPLNQPADVPTAKVAHSHGEIDETELKFHLHRQSPLADSPLIGPRIAERLAKLKIDTVDDLLALKPSAVAKELKLRRVDESTVRNWQQQVKLVCRVPRLRSQNAQLLVAAGITEPERLAQCDPQWLLSQIEPISRSGQGQRILRGGKQPDLTDVTQWIRFAKQHRELRAA